MSTFLLNTYKYAFNNALLSISTIMSRIIGFRQSFIILKLQYILKL